MCGPHRRARDRPLPRLSASQTWTAAFMRLRAFALQMYQINPMPATINRLWLAAEAGGGNLTMDEAEALFVNCAELKMKRTAFHRLFHCVDEQQQGYVDREGFEALFHLMMKNQTTNWLWRKYAGSADAPNMTPEQFKRFLSEEQGVWRLRSPGPGPTVD